MRRYLPLASIVAAVILLVAVVLAGTGPMVTAQPSTPASSPAASGPKPKVTIIAESGAQRSKAEQATLVRVELEPGASSGLVTADGNRILYVEEGTIRFRLDSGKVSLTDASGPSKGKPVAKATWIDVQAGQSLIVSKNAKYEYQNDSDAPAIILASGGSDVTTEGCGGGCS